MKIVFDTETKVTAFLEESGATVVHPTEETVKVSTAGAVTNVAGQSVTVPGYVSELGPFFGINSADAGAENPTYSTGDREVRARVTLDDSGEYNYPMPSGRTVYELIRPASGSAAVAVHFNGAKGKVRVELVGDPGGAVNGGANLAVNGIQIDGTVMEGNLDSFRKEINLAVAGTLDVNLRLDGGAPTVLLVVTPL